MNWLMLGLLLFTLVGFDIDGFWADRGATRETGMTDDTAAVQFGGSGIPPKSVQFGGSGIPPK